MNWIAGMQNAIDYIERHILEDIDYGTLAEQSFSSSYHFQRIFSILCGFTVGEYIRNRRLSLAGAELATEDVKIIDIAFKYGYESPDSFTRAFHRFHGILPSQARSRCSELKVFSRLVLKISLEGGRLMNYRIENTAEMVLTGFKKRFSGLPNERDGQEEEMYLNTRPLQHFLAKLSKTPETTFEVITNIEDDGFDFYIAYHLPQGSLSQFKHSDNENRQLALECEELHVPAQTYAVFETERCKYPTAISLSFRKQIAAEWLPASGYQLAEAPEFVVTHWYMGDQERKQKRYRELWIPIVHSTQN